MNKRTLSLTLGAVLMTACSSRPPEKEAVKYPAKSPEVTTTNPKETSTTAKQVATEQQSRFVAQVKFPQGSSALSEGDLRKIRSEYEEASKAGKIESVQLITWADQEYPSKKKESLSQKQTELVERRNDYLEEQISRLGKDLEVVKVSMAERADTLERYFGQEQAEVKESLGQADVATTAKKEGSRMASEAIVIFVPEK